ncbi:MAG: hypothetical protein PUB09_05895 [Firmicutes bacterium]|nr:hypothetical protein [Bacillota bacterium]
MKTDLKKQLAILIAAGIFLIIIDLVSAFTLNTAEFSKDSAGTFITRSDKTDHISLRARTFGKGIAYDREFDVSISPYATENPSRKSEDKYMPKDEFVAQEIRSIVMSFNDDTSIRKIYLPNVLSNGQKVTWTVVRNTHTVLIIFTCLLTGFLLYHRRNAPVIRKKKMQRQSIARQLPEFVNRLVLLLNAGLVLNSAFERAIQEGLRFQDNDLDYFWSKMNDIYISIRETNSSANQEFRSFAKESGVNELIRISNILNDNVSKGVELTQKLYAESELLWINRKRSCEEHGKISEEKMVLPLTILLLVLVAITVSPALLEL